MRRALWAFLAGCSISATAFADLALAKSRNCMSCHAIDKKVVGPAYLDVARKYAGHKDALETLASKITKGGAGVWGAVPMPVNKQVSDDEAKRLAAWVLGLK
ncbi:MAG: c-type cytochrome [Rhodoferax sp.]